MDAFLIAIITFILVVLGTLVFFFSRYKRCPSDKVLVIYGKTGGNRSSKCVHGGASFVWPLIQDFQWLDLTPFSIDIQLKDALSKESSGVEMLSAFTVGISTEKGVMENAAERLLSLNLKSVSELANDIIIGEMRKIIASLKIAEFKTDTEILLNKISRGVMSGLRQIGLNLISINIKRITISKDTIPSTPQF
ncbi:MAG: flotillin family protein [Opitutae bacterium]|nr:flotillin family protein [Opitutae bacterium]